MTEPQAPGAVPLDQSIELQRQYRLQWEPKQDCFVLLYPEGMVQLKGSSGAIMKYVDGTRNVNDIVALLEQAFPGNDLRQDVIGFLEHAYGKGWIRVKT
jgi:pyrroloquinoline quinone biosynthesis protein D